LFGVPEVLSSSGPAISLFGAALNSPCSAVTWNSWSLSPPLITDAASLFRSRRVLLLGGGWLDGGVRVVVGGRGAGPNGWSATLFL
ncbi:hypothetical protein Dimus_003398, partial [Dionaea muscipula]